MVHTDNGKAPKTLNIKLLCKDLFPNSAFALDNEETIMNQNRINESNYKKYFRITDLEQGYLGKLHI